MLLNAFILALREIRRNVLRSSLTALGLILFVVTFIVLAAAKLMLVRMAKQRGE